FRWVGDRTLDSDILDAINLDVRARYNQSGHGWVTTTVLDGKRVLRVTVMNPRTTEHHLDLLLDQLALEAERRR
ncbi:MAG: pyridoxal-dependent decarboxylase, partial [Gemmatimonadales bacterium]